MSDRTLIVERGGHWIFYILMGLLPGFLTYVALKNIYVGLSAQPALTGGFWISIALLIICAPLTFYYFAFGTRKKRIFEITELGILTSNSQLIKWSDILEIETDDYPGPRMRFYTLKIILNSFQKKSIKIIFSSDIKPSWDNITEVLANYTVKYNIPIT
jgi:hypothetical protein